MRTLLLRGTLIGGLFPLVVVVTCLVLLVQDRLLARQEQQLRPDAERYDLAEQSLNDLVEQMDALKPEIVPLLLRWQMCDPVRHCSLN